MKKLLILLGILILLALAIGAYFFFTRPAPTGTAPASNPFGLLNAPDGSSSDRTYPLVLADGTAIAVPDFTKGPQPEWAGTDTGYRVAGDEDTGDYVIVYLGPDHEGGQGQFLVTLFAEPLGEVRRRAEAALRARLLIPDADICKLDVLVSTAPGVNETYDGLRLGLSFCPGSVKLP